MDLSSSDWQHFIYSLLILLVLVGNLGSRKLPFSKTLKYLGIWSLIALIIISLYSYRYEFSDFKNRLFAEINPSKARVNKENQLVVKLSDDGHFYINVLINSQQVRFMVDTGASDIVLNINDAKKVGLNINNLTFNKRYQTANGSSFGASVVLEKFVIGNIELSNINASVNNADMGTSLLGMSFLRNCKKYEFYRDSLILTF
ncbi:MAG: TIGR02281 family clan AA aspartic protease [Pelagibacterales bacterium]|nr:TIGR02281 family clan AA aspartic protease [Pelagibacterales bacterium]